MMCNELDSNALNCIVKIFMMFYSIFYNKGTNSSLINDFKLTLPERIGITIFEKYLRALKKL